MYNPYENKDNEKPAEQNWNPENQQPQAEEYKPQQEQPQQEQPRYQPPQQSYQEPQYQRTQYTEPGYQPPRPPYTEPVYGQQSYQSPYKAPKQKKKGSKWVLKVIAAALIIGVLGGACFGGVNLLIDHFGGDTARPGADLSAPPKATDTELAVSGQKQDIPYTSVQTGDGTGTAILDVTSVVDNAMPAMVSINVVVTKTVQDPYSMFGHYFGFGGYGSYEQEVPGSGSGIIIGENDAELLIVTNNHVVGDANEIAIEFIDGESASAYLKGTDENSDLAVVAVPISELKPETTASIKIAVMGSSDSLQLGEPAIAIGNALGYGQSVTVGYISALEREVTLTDGTITLLQTDAAINPGNSGGALLNIKGEVVGINSAKYSDTSVEGMGFAIPITDAIPIINELMNSVPDSEKPYLGISGQAVPESYRSYFDWPEGVYVVEVANDSPAALAGLRQGDIITGFNDTTITSMDELQDALAKCAVGDTVQLSVVRTQQNRDGITLQDLELTAVLIARSEAKD